MESRKDMRTRESEWRAKCNEAKRNVPGTVTPRLPEPPVEVKFK